MITPQFFSTKSIPSLEMVKMYFSQKALPEKEAVDFYQHYSIQQWRNRNGDFYRSWKKIAYNWVQQALRHCSEGRDRLVH